YSAFFGIIILLGVVIFFYRRRKILQKLCIKPDEPWKLEKEKKYLDKLKEKDNEKYDETMKMMKDEYKSSLLWYKHYRKGMLKKSKEIGAKTPSLLSKKSNKPEIEQKTKLKEPEHKPKKQEKAKDETEQQMVKEEMPEKQEKPEQKNDETSELEKQKRNQAILKIKKAQEKQRRKLKL
ncbi:MAG: hypothetical protein U9O49_01310, partial [Candidatus Thermoplasmatota archaeon]|nr:hypothetical protein [Candidatus Thermoplasmatota archaeon]